MRRWPRKRGGSLPAAEIIAADAARIERFPERDLLIAAYSLGEIGAGAAIRLWQAARVALVIIEPGTPKGFALIRAIRDELLAAGAHMAAPCPGAMACPMVASRSVPFRGAGGAIFASPAIEGRRTWIRG